MAQPKPTQLQRASRLGLVVPMKKLLHSCKYSTGANRTILSEVQLQLPVKEGTPNYNIQFVSTFEDLNTPKKNTLWQPWSSQIPIHLCEVTVCRWQPQLPSFKKEVSLIRQLKDPGTWYKMRNAFVCSQNATTDPPARWTYSRKCTQDQMFTFLCLQIEEHFSLHLKNQ